MRRHAPPIAAALVAFSAGLVAAGGHASLVSALPLFLLAAVLVKLVATLQFDLDFLPVAALSLFLWAAGVYAFINVSEAFDRDAYEGESLEASTAPRAPVIPEDTVITLERTGCYGRCPSYTVSIFADGSVVFYASPRGHFTRLTGAARRQISPEQLRGLLSEFDRAGYFSLKDRYETAGDGCPTVSTDAPWAVISLQIGGRKKTVTHYHGCQTTGRDWLVFPRELTALETKIDEAAGSWDWVRRPEVSGGHR